MARTIRIRQAAETPSTGESPGEVQFRPNSAALSRAWRLFALYVVALVVIYGTFVGLLWSSRAGFAGNPTSAPAFLTLLAVILGVGGFFLTLARTPRGVEFRSDATVLTEFSGRRRVYGRTVPIDVRVESRYPAGLLAPEPTALVLLGASGRPARRYLLNLSLLARFQGGGAPGLFE